MINNPFESFLSNFRDIEKKMNDNVETVKVLINAQNLHNQLFMERISSLERKIKHF